jgi:D-alanine-D-alanine ligase-like ATP-grasp enzyme
VLSVADMLMSRLQDLSGYIFMSSLHLPLHCMNINTGASIIIVRCTAVEEGCVLSVADMLMSRLQDLSGYIFMSSLHLPLHCMNINTGASIIIVRCTAVEAGCVLSVAEMVMSRLQDLSGYIFMSSLHLPLHCITIRA